MGVLEKNAKSTIRKDIIMNKKVLEIKNVSFGYSSVDILKNVSFHGSAGEILVLAGPNGSGKTTLIKLIFDLLERDRGEIYINGEDNRKISAKKQIIYLQSDNELPRFLTGDEYIKLMCKLYNVEIDNLLYLQLMEYYEMQDSANHLIESYSYGMVKKIQLIAAFLIQAQITVIDETLNGIDIKAKEISIVLMKKLIEKGKLVLLCTHDLLLAEKIGNRVELINNGNVFADVNLPFTNSDMSLVNVFKDMIGFEESNYEL